MQCTTATSEFGSTDVIFISTRFYFLVLLALAAYLEAEEAEGGEGVRGGPGSGDAAPEAAALQAGGRAGVASFPAASFYEELAG